MANSTVYGIATRGTKVYVGGYFSSINNTARNSAAALEASTGALTPFVVKPAGGYVRQFGSRPTVQVVLGGNFTSLNGSNRPGYGLAMVDGATGGSLPMAVNNTIRNAGTDSAIFSLAQHGRRLLRDRLPLRQRHPATSKARSGPTGTAT